MVLLMNGRCISHNSLSHQTFVSFTWIMRCGEFSQSLVYFNYVDILGNIFLTVEFVRFIFPFSFASSV